MHHNLTPPLRSSVSLLLRVKLLPLLLLKCQNAEILTRHIAAAKANFVLAAAATAKPRLNQKRLSNMTILLHDEDVHKLSYADAVQVMENFFLQKHTAGQPRSYFEYEEGKNLTFTIGASDESVGFRVYLRGGFEKDEQLVAVWDRETGALKGLIVGAALGVMRTGAIGGVAVKYLAPANATTLALIGTGRQALSQLRAIATVRPLQEVRVFSRNAENRQKFCQEAQALLPNLSIHSTESAEDAVRDAEIVVTATTSSKPVLQLDWLHWNAHVTTLGTKGRYHREVDEALVYRTAFIASDSPSQTRNYPDGSILDGSNHQLHNLEKFVSDKLKRPDGISLFISSGLAGTEVALASHILALNAQA